MDSMKERVLSILSTTPARWQELTRALPADLATEAPAPAEWSAVECLIHMVDTERLFQFRLAAFLEGRDFPAFNPDEEGTRSANPQPAALAAEFAARRAESLGQLERLTPADYERTARHAELGPVTLREMLNEWAAHDLNHTVQAERALMQPFIRACGPWVKYFTSQVIEG